MTFSNVVDSASNIQISMGWISALFSHLTNLCVAIGRLCLDPWKCRKPRLWLPLNLLWWRRMGLNCSKNSMTHTAKKLVPQVSSLYFTFERSLSFITSSFTPCRYLSALTTLETRGLLKRSRSEAAWALTKRLVRRKWTQLTIDWYSPTFDD